VQKHRYYRNKKTGLIVQVEYIETDYIRVMLAGGISASLYLNEDVLYREFEPYAHLDTDAASVRSYAGERSLCCTITELPPPGFEGEKRLLRLDVPLTEIIDAMYDRIKVAYNGEPAYPKDGGS